MNLPNIVDVLGLVVIDLSVEFVSIFYYRAPLQWLLFHSEDNLPRVGVACHCYFLFCPYTSACSMTRHFHKIHCTCLLSFSESDELRPSPAAVTEVYRLKLLAEQRNRKVVDVSSDGNCLFSALALQCGGENPEIVKSSHERRLELVKYVKRHRNWMPVSYTHLTLPTKRIV